MFARIKYILHRSHKHIEYTKCEIICQIKHVFHNFARITILDYIVRKMHKMQPGYFMYHLIQLFHDSIFFYNFAVNVPHAIVFITI